MAEPNQREACALCVKFPRSLITIRQPDSFASGQFVVDSLYSPPTRPPMNCKFRARVKKRNQLP